MIDKTKRKRLEEKAWTLTSRIVRLKAADDQGYCRCFTCGVSKHWKQIDAGHWLSRGKKPTKYHRQNIRVQCKRCNKWGHPNLAKQRGEPFIFERNLRKEGVDTEWLLKLSRSEVAGTPQLEDFVGELKDEIQAVVADAFGRGIYDARDALKGAKR